MLSLNKQIKMPKACIHDNVEDRCVAEEGPHCICRLSAFVLSNGSSLALFVGRGEYPKVCVNLQTDVR